MRAARCRRPPFFFTALTTLVANVWVATPRAVAAGGGDRCNPNRSNNYLTNYFVGASQTLGTNTATGGVSAYIRSYSLCGVWCFVTRHHTLSGIC